MYTNSRILIPDASSVCSSSVASVPKVTDVPPRVVYTAAKPVGSYDPYARPLAAKDLASKTDAAPRAAVVKAAVAGGDGFGQNVSSPRIIQTNQFMRARSASFVPLETVMARMGTAAPTQSEHHPSALLSAVPSHFKYSTRGLSTQRLNGHANVGSTASVNIPDGTANIGSSSHSLRMQPDTAGTVTHVTSETRYQRSNHSQNSTSVADSDNNKQTIDLDVSALVNTNHNNSGFSAKIPGVRQNWFSELDQYNIANKSNNHDLKKPNSITPDKPNICDKQLNSPLMSSVGNDLSSENTAISSNSPPVLPRNIHIPASSSEVSSGELNYVKTHVYTDLPSKNHVTSQAPSSESVLSDSRLQINRDRSKSGNNGQLSSSFFTDTLKENFGASRPTFNPVKVITVKTSNGVTGKPPNGATGKKFSKLGNELQKPVVKSPVLELRNHSRSQQETSRPRLPSRQSLAKDQPQASNPRPLPPRPQSKISKKMIVEKGKSGKKSSLGRKLASSIDRHSCSSYQTEFTTSESTFGNDDDLELDSLGDENCSTDLGSNVSDDDSSRGTGSVISQSLARSRSDKVPSRSRRPRVLPQRKASNVLKPNENAFILSISGLAIDDEPLPALAESLFSNVPPTLNFVLQGQKVESLPDEFKKMLRWRISSTTPNIVKQCIARTGFKISSKSCLWLGYWGKHIKPVAFKTIREYQKMNHFPGTFQIGRKDRLWRNLSRMFSRFGKKEFGFFPQTYILPADLATLKMTFEEGNNKLKWIIKPPASSCGAGIQVIHKWNEIPKNRALIVQRYIAHPFLINKSKFDLRIYVYVTSFDPLRIYVYEDGLVRFASVKYSNSLKTLHNRFIHLTNYSVNKRNSGYEPNSDEEVCQGHKWSLRALWIYFQRHGIDSSVIWTKIKDLIIKTILSAESLINSMVKANVRRRYSCHELFGFDVLLDEKLKPWIIEVNISPSLHSNSQLDVNIKGGMIRDLFNLAGFQLPEKQDLLQNPGPAPDLSSYEPSNDICIDRRLWPNQKSSDEKAKHQFYTQRATDEQLLSTILDILTPDDIRMLTETVDENSRRGDFLRVFPSATSQRYQVFFEQPRYYNLLLQAWCNKYHAMESKGISLLESCCRKGINLQNPTSDPKHQWAPPSGYIATRDVKNANPSPSKTSVS